jgi:alpha-1,6-mannosyltransferase
MRSNHRGTSRLICDLTQSWSSEGGGVRTYLDHKRSHILERTRHRHLLIIPGPSDSVEEEERAITVRIASPMVPASRHYRLLLRNSAVRAALERFRPDVIECQDSYNLPWAAIAHRKRYPETVLVAGYFTDFPTVYVQRPFAKFIGRGLAGVAGRVCYRYCGNLYRRFDALYVLSENGGLEELRRRGIENPRTVPLGVELGEFRPDRRDRALRKSLGLNDAQPLLIYVGRLHIEKKPDTVVEAFRRLPEELGAKLVLLGEGPLREQFAELNDPRIIMPGYVRDRGELARWLASADIYVSGFAQETFGVSIVEAQASALPVVGVAGGALLDRVSDEVGRLGPVNDPEAMARNILELWSGDRKTMGKAARERALQFSWDRTFEILFSDVYPLAFANRQAALLRGEAGALVRGAAS